jgi:hypothetical protein
MWRRFGLACGALALAMPVWAGVLAGVTLPDTISVGEKSLTLNGMGLRKKAIFKVYVGALYLTGKAPDPAAIIAAEAPWRMVMHFLRDVEAAKVAEAWKEGVTNNSPAALPAVKDRLEEFCSRWQDMEEGKEAVMTFVPGTGTRLEIAGKELAVIAGEDFADALLSVWLGPAPPSEELKAGVLGK